MDQQNKTTEVSQIPEGDTFLNEVMPPSNEQLICRLEDLVRMTLDLEKHDLRKDVPFSEIMKSLAVVQRAVEAIGEDQEQLQIVIDLMKAQIGDLPTEKVPPTAEEKRLAERMANLSQICEAARERLHNQLLKTPGVTQTLQDMVFDTEASPKRKSVRRKRKFRSMGEGGWIKS